MQQHSIDIKSKDIQMIDIDKLAENPDNRNRHSKEQIERLSEIIKYQGFRSPIIVSNRSGLIVAGHGRLMAARQLKMKQVPVSFQDFESEEQEYAAQISDNAIADWAELDLAAINADLEKLGPELDIKMLGIKDFVLEVAEKLEPQCDEDEVPEAVEPRTKLGDIYQLGRHRLMCGDSTSIDAVEKLMNGEKADMVFTDPPYGISYSGHYSTDGGNKVNRENLKVNNFSVIKGDTDILNMAEVLAPFDYVKEIFVWGAQNFAASLSRSTWLCWDRKLTESADKSLSGDFDLCWSKQKHKMKMYRHTWHGVFGHSKKDDGDKKVHPTMKPVALIEDLFSDYAKEGGNIVDLFGGSGSTLIACEKTNRQCFMMELDPHYCDVIVSRWEKYTGKKAILLNAPQEPQEIP